MTNPETSGAQLFEASAQVIKAARTARKALGWSARVLAERCDEAASPHKSPLTRGRIAKLESGSVQTVSVDELMLLSQALHMPVQDLLGIIKTEDAPTGGEIVSRPETHLTPERQIENSGTPEERLTRVEQHLGAVMHALDGAGIEVDLPANVNLAPKGGSDSLPPEPLFQPPLANKGKI